MSKRYTVIRERVSTNGVIALLLSRYRYGVTSAVAESVGNSWAITLETDHEDTLAAMMNLAGLPWDYAKIKRQAEFGGVDA